MSPTHLKCLLLLPLGVSRGAQGLLPLAPLLHAPGHALLQHVAPPRHLQQGGMGAGMGR